MALARSVEMKHKVYRQVSQVGLCVTYSMCGCSTHGAVPPFARREIRAMYLKFLFGRIPLGDRLEASNIAPMAELRLRVAANDVVVEDFRHPIFLLLF